MLGRSDRLGRKGEANDGVGGDKDKGDANWCVGDDKEAREDTHPPL